MRLARVSLPFTLGDREHISTVLTSWPSEYPLPLHSIEASKKVYLRLERKGDCFRTSFMEDGKRWKESLSKNIALPARLAIGVFVASDSPIPFKARFDKLKLDRTSRKKPR